jgi:hypothetical protein
MPPRNWLADDPDYPIAIDLGGPIGALRAASDPAGSLPEGFNVQLAQLVTTWLEARSPWRRWVQKVPLRGDVAPADRYGGSATSYPAQTYHGPSAQPVATWRPSNGADWVPAADITWGTNPVTAVPQTLGIETLVSEEELLTAAPMDDVVNGQAVFTTPLPVLRFSHDMLMTIPPWVFRTLALGMLNAENLAFAQGAGTVADPIVGLDTIAGVTTFAASGILLDDLWTGIHKLRALHRFPTVAWVSPGGGKLLRNTKGVGGGAPLLDPQRPIVLDDGNGDPVPVLVHDGLADGAAVRAYVVDASVLISTWQLQAQNWIIRAKGDAHAKFATDQVVLQLFERWSLQVVPNQAAGIVRITALNAPAP